MPLIDIERTRAETPTALVRSVPPEPPNLDVPASNSAVQVGRYEIGHLIGAGGMATVHLGRLVADGGFARIVAIKRLLPNYAHNSEFQQLIENEGRLAARIQHPNVVPTHDVVTADGELLLVMDYVPGASLDILTSSIRRRGGRVPLLIALAIVCDALHGLHAAHEAKDGLGRSLNIVHRDVSPHNLLVGADGIARVLDFGIAKAADSVTTTSTGMIRGKLAYMAPEQLLGEKLNRRTDVYAVGVVLWELLTGRRLHNNTGQASRASSNVPRPSTLAPIPKSLDEIVVRALAQDPSRRFASALEMASQIEAVFTPAGRAEVSKWVRAEACEELDRRRYLVQSLEGGTRPHPGGHLTTSVTTPRGTRRRRSQLWKASLGVAVCMGGLAALITFLQANQHPGADSLAAEAPFAAPSFEMTRPAAALSPAVVALLQEPAPSSSASSKPPPTAHPKLAPRTEARRSKQTPDCQVPYTIDSAGRKLYKSRCL